MYKVEGVFSAVKKKAVEENCFSGCIEKLEDILRKLEDGKESLESALELYSSGVQIIKSCEESLRIAEQKVMDISAVSSGELEKERELAFLNEVK